MIASKLSGDSEYGDFYLGSSCSLQEVAADVISISEANGVVFVLCQIVKYVDFIARK